jgi:hypothetical protein
MHSFNFKKNENLMLECSLCLARVCIEVLYMCSIIFSQYFYTLLQLKTTAWIDAIAILHFHFTCCALTSFSSM